MAKIIYTEMAKNRGDTFDGVKAEFDGRTFEIKFYGRDIMVRPYPVRLAALKKYLDGCVRADAQKRGRPMPELDAK